MPLLDAADYPGLGPVFEMDVVAVFSAVSWCFGSAVVPRGLSTAHRARTAITFFTRSVFEPKRIGLQIAYIADRQPQLFSYLLTCQPFATQLPNLVNPLGTCAIQWTA